MIGLTKVKMTRRWGFSELIKFCFRPEVGCVFANVRAELSTVWFSMVSIKADQF